MKKRFWDFIRLDWRFSKYQPGTKGEGSEGGGRRRRTWKGRKSKGRTRGSRTDCCGPQQCVYIHDIYKKKGVCMTYPRITGQQPESGEKVDRRAAVFET